MKNFLKERILNFMRKQNGKEFSTHDLVSVAFPEKYGRIKEDLQNPIKDKGKDKEVKRKVAQLHRKLLYHLNILLEENKIIQTKISNKGEKYFAMNEFSRDIPEDDSETKYAKVPLFLLSAQSKSENVQLVEKDQWIEQVNSVLIDCSQLKNIEKIIRIIDSIKESVNDAIALYNFESLLGGNLEKKSIENLIKTVEELKEYNVILNIIIDLENYDNYSRLFKVIKGMLDISEKKQYKDHLKIIFEISNENIKFNEKFIEEVVEIFSSKRKNIFVKNKTNYKSPFFIGRYGPYSFDEERWRIFVTEEKANSKIYICTNNTVLINVNGMIESSKNHAKVRKQIIEIAKLLLHSTYFKNRRSHVYLRDILRINYPDIVETKIISSSCIRFYNYIDKSSEKTEINAGLFESIKEMIIKFSNTEKSIYKSCGIPLLFSVILSIFPDESSLLNIANPRKLMDNPVKENLEIHEKISQALGGASLIRIKNQRDVKSQDIIKEIHYITSYYRMPLIEIINENCRKEHKLTDFIK